MICGGAAERGIRAVLSASIRYEYGEHRRHGSVGPLESSRTRNDLAGEFIPIAEENGFIVALGTWVLEEACRQNKEWQQKGYPPIPVSVNLSVRQFEMDNLSETVQEVLAKTGLNPAYLDLEITESMTMDVPRASPVLQQLKDMGVAISIDDFGTGYSSLHYLKISRYTG